MKVALQQYKGNSQQIMALIWIITLIFSWKRMI